MSYESFGGGNVETEKEFQTILPGSTEYLIILNYLSNNKRYKINDVILGRESNYMNKGIKNVSRHIFNVSTNISTNINYTKTKISVSRPFVSLDLSTTFRVAAEESTSHIVNPSNHRVRNKLYIRHEYIDKEFDSNRIHLTLSWDINDQLLKDKEYIDMIKNVLMLISDPKYHPLLITSQNMFTQILEMEVKKMKDDDGVPINHKAFYFFLINPIC